MSETANLSLPYISASQAQKHVTHNEALRLLDGLVQLSVIDRDLTAPPGSPSAGDRYIVASGGSGAWTDWDGAIAYFVDGVWMQLQPRAGWRCWVADEEVLAIHDGADWSDFEAGGGFEPAPSIVLAEGAAGSAIGLATTEELVSGLSGAFVETSILIPQRSIVLAVSCRTVTAVTGASSYDCGIDGETSKFGGMLGAGAGSTNIGVIGPSAFYSDTPVRLTANGGNFSGGAVWVAIQYITFAAPDS